MLKRFQVVSASLILAILVASTAADEAKEKQAHIDQLIVAAQKICPVSGKPLDSMGSPVKADVGGATTFLCCKGCFGQKIPPKHWATITANVNKAQGSCPVLDKPLPEKSASVVVGKRRIFVCCPPCIDKVKADPEKYVAIVNRMLETNLGVENANRSETKK